jgi:hypothetical protein
MLAVVQRLDKHFWEYSLARMKTLALGLPLNTARLIKIRKQMYKLQDEARVAIAHYRGNTLQTVADIQKWKFLCQQETQTKDTVEIMLGNVNYLEKMTRDVEALDDTTVARLWLGHAPTTFMTTSDPQTTLNPSILDERAIRIEFLEKAILDAAATYPNVERTHGSPLPFARRLPTGNPPVPTAPWALSIPKGFADKLPEHGLRSFLDGALVAKAARLGLDRLPERDLPPPRALPSLDSVATSRHLDEALVCILAALPLTAPLPSERLLTTLRWLRSALALRPVRTPRAPRRSTGRGAPPPLRIDSRDAPTQ